MDHRRIPPAVIPIATFFAVSIIYALARGALTPKSLLIRVISAVVLIFAATSMNRGPYI